jgi:hypothetical protein
MSRCCGFVEKLWICCGFVEKLWICCGFVEKLWICCGFAMDLLYNLLYSICCTTCCTANPQQIEQVEFELPCGPPLVTVVTSAAACGTAGGDGCYTVSTLTTSGADGRSSAAGGLADVPKVTSSPALGAKLLFNPGSNAVIAV